MVTSKKLRRSTLAILTGLMIILLFNLADSQTGIAAPQAAPATIETNWHAFLGSEPASGDSDDDRGYDVAVDSDGDAYVVGQSNSGNWGGTLIITHTLGLDGFLAKLDREGTLLWHTFIGGSESDSAQAITIGADDNLFVVGTSYGGNWSTVPITNNHGGRDAFVAKFNTSGKRQWFTFVGTGDDEWGNALTVGDGGNIYVGGTSVVNPYLAKLNNAGEFQWQRVITSADGDLGNVHSIAVGQDGAVYLTGDAKYGMFHSAPAPVRPHAGSPTYADAFVAKFDADGQWQWLTFLGAADTEDSGHAIIIPPSLATSTVYIAGQSGDGWATPLNPHTGHVDAFVAQLNGTNGKLIWNTFMGNATYGDSIDALALNNAHQLFVAGASASGWGRPVLPHPGGGVGDAAFVAALSMDGQFLGNTFVGGASSSDTASGIAISQQGDIYITGSSWSPDSVGWGNALYWDTPTRAFSGDHDAFVAGLGTRSVIRYWVYAPLILKH